MERKPSADRLSSAAASVWAKSRKHDVAWLPLWRHLDDSAGIAGRLWDVWLPEALKRTVSAPLPDGIADGRRLAVWLAGIHDIGKATPAFAVQWRTLANRMYQEGLEMPTTIPYEDRKHALHALAGQLVVEDWLSEIHAWSRKDSQQYSIVVGGHHGVPPTQGEVRQARDRPELLGWRDDQTLWRNVQFELLDRAAAAYGVVNRLPHWRTARLPQTSQVLLTALVIVADWIASNEDLFSYDPTELTSPSRLEEAWAELDLPAPWRAIGTPAAEDLFSSRFTLPAGATPYPVQLRAVDIARRMAGAGLLVIEAPMGEGKTEAALAAAEVLAAQSGAGGCFIALPTRATSDAMFLRVMDWLEHVPDADADRGALSLMLAHGKARFNDDYVALMRHGRSTVVDLEVGDRTVSTRDLAAHQWLSGRKKAILSSFVVGTIDQLLLGALKSRHLVLRHLGLAGKVVIIDEAHAYDVYMSQYLDRALEWLGSYGVPTIVLSATLPASRRRAMLQAYERGRGGTSPAARPRKRWLPSATPPDPAPRDALDGATGYPLLTASRPDGTPLIETAAASGNEVGVVLERTGDDLASLSARLHTELAGGGCALVIRNTVRRVQETAKHLRLELGPLGFEIAVAHSRFLAPDRAAKDAWLRDTFGPPERSRRSGTTRPPGPCVVVASQVAEQSLDLDFDLLVTDLAPVDLVLQRMGRMHRHLRGEQQSERPERLRQARCVITGVDWTTTPPEPASGLTRVYDRHQLLRSLAVLTPYLDGAGSVRLPADISPLVQRAYGDTPIGPAEWRPAMQRAQRNYERKQEARQERARTFRLGQAGEPGEPIIGWLAGSVGDKAQDEQEGRAQVRDVSRDSLEVLVVVRRGDGAVVVPPWLRTHGGKELPTEHPPSWELAKAVATCTLALPIELSGDSAIEELERDNYFDGWQQSLWLEGQLVLVIDDEGTAELAGHTLHYDPQDGLVTHRIESPNRIHAGGHTATL